MRDIKFRGVHPELKVAMGVCVIDWMHNEIYFEQGTDVSYPIEDCNLMQFTGLKDINGVDIYEGDILFADRNNSRYTVCFGTHELSSHYDSSPNECTGFYLYRHKLGFIESIGGDYSMLKVIGNIYQNPELLEENNNA